jgi:ABC-2 type transport system permease protein
MIFSNETENYRSNSIPSKTNSYLFTFYQILIIAYTTGILWLRRNPLSLIFSAITPFSLLFVLFIISDGQYTQFALVFYFGVTLVYIPLLIFIILIVWISTSSMGFFLSSHMLHMKNATQIISFVNIFLAILPPVFYSISKLPEMLQYASYIVPTTHASLMIQYAMGFDTPQNWSVLIGISVQLVYAIAFLILAKSHALWRET